MSKCYRCGGPLEKHHEKTNWAYLAGSVRSVTETTSTTRLIVRVTTVKHTDHGAIPHPSMSEVLLCFDCHGAVMAFIGVGKRPEDRMPKASPR